MDKKEDKKEGAEAAQTTVANAQESVPKGAVRIREVAARFFPDREFVDDDDVQGALLEDYEAAKNRLQESEASNKAVYEMIQANPTLADVLTSMVKDGDPFEVALAKHVDLDALKPVEGEANYESYRKAAAERKARTEQIALERQTLEANHAKTKADAEAFFAEKGMAEEEVAEFLDFIEGFSSGLFRGEVDKTVLNKMYQAFKYDEAVAAAAEQGQIDGRNQSIETKRTAAGATDGVPEAGSAVAVTGEPKPKKRVFEI